MGDGGVSRWLTPRRWRILSFLALHGCETTMDVAVVAGISRLTAHRDLTWLHGAGLVSRWRSDEDRTHTWWYKVTDHGIRLLSRDLSASGRPVPLQLGQRHWSAAHDLLFLPLVEVSRQKPGRCELFGWLTTMAAPAQPGPPARRRLRRLAGGRPLPAVPCARRPRPGR
jgi:DNA-binding MarR family transcriptional regulator